MRRGMLAFLFVLAGMTMASASARAQVGRCTNGQINQAYTALRLTANGSGVAGDCNPNNYGAGSWTGLSDLEVRIQHAHVCSDPWIGQIYWYTYNRNPSAAECTVTLYGGGRWSSYMDLAAKVTAYHNASSAGPALAVNQYRVDQGGNLVDARGAVVAYSGTYVVGPAGGSLIGPSGGTLVGPSGGTLLPTPGMLLTIDPSTLTQRSVLSVGSKRVIAATVVHR